MYNVHEARFITASAQASRVLGSRRRRTGFPQGQHALKLRSWLYSSHPRQVSFSTSLPTVALTLDSTRFLLPSMPAAVSGSDIGVIMVLIGGGVDVSTDVGPAA